MSDRILFATRKGLFVSTRSKGRWQISKPWFLAQNVSMTLFDPSSGWLYAALEHGHFGCKLHRSHDEGETWEECSAPIYPKKPDGVQDLDPFRKTERSWNLTKIWILEVGADGRLWCGTIPGGLFYSDDQGSTWTMCRSLWDMPNRKQWAGGGYDDPGIHSISIDPRDPARLTLAVSTGGVWRTENAGKTWQLHGSGLVAEYMPPEQANDPNVQDVHRLVRCAGSPEAMWIQHHNGIFVSQDEAKTWHRITTAKPSQFGFAVGVHPKDADLAWFVPAVKDECRVPVDGRLVVMRTKNGGKSFDAMGDGLPKRNCYDLVYRHGLDVDDKGKRVAIGTTTGDAWVSEDRGSSWLSIKAHLPPIHVVRFF